MGSAPESNKNCVVRIQMAMEAVNHLGTVADRQLAGQRCRRGYRKGFINPAFFQCGHFGRSSRAREIRPIPVDLKNFMAEDHHKRAASRSLSPVACFV